jgi:simple sugar transport system permease protein
MSAPEQAAAAAPPDAPPEAKQAARPSLWDTLLVTLLAFVAALAVGAVLIAIADPATRHASTYFFSWPWDTFTNAGTAIGNGRSARTRSPRAPRG